MNLVPFIQAAGAVHLVIAAANFFIPKKLDYAGNVAKCSSMVRKVFWVHAAYIVLVLVGFAGLCFLFAEELASGRGLGRGVAAFLAVFWVPRVAIQLCVYDGEVRRANRFFDVAFLLAFAYLGLVFAAAAAGAGR